MKRNNLIAAVLAVLFLTAFFLIVPGLYITGATNTGQMNIKEIDFPDEAENGISGEVLFDILGKVNTSNTIAYESREMKSRDFYVSQILKIVEEAFSGSKNMYDGLRHELDILENPAMKEKPSLVKYCIVTVRENGDIVSLPLIIYSDSDIMLCFEENSGTLVFLRLKNYMSDYYLSLVEQEIDSVQRYFENIGMLDSYVRLEFSEVLYEDDYSLTVILGMYQFYWQCYGWIIPESVYQISESDGEGIIWY